MFIFPVQALAVGLPAINLLASNIMIGKFVGEVGLAAVGFLSPLNKLVSIFSAMLSTGLQILLGRYLGKGDKDGMKKTFSTCICTGVAIGTVIALLVFLFPGTIATLLGARDEVHPMVVEYLRGYFPSIFLLIAGSGLLLCLQLDNAKKLSTIAIVLQLVTSASLSFVFLKILNMGMIGAGLAATAGNLVLNVVCCSHFTNSKNFRFSICSYSVDSLKEIFTFGSNAGLINVWSFIRSTIFNNAVFAIGGTVAMSAMTVAHNVSDVIGNTIEGGMYGSSGIIASVLVGKREVKALRRLHKNVATFILPISFMAYVIIFVFAKPIALFFGADIQNIDIYVMTIRVFNMFMLLSYFKSAPAAIYNALGKVKMIVVIGFIESVIASTIVIESGVLINSLPLTITYSSFSIIAGYLIYLGYYIFKTHSLPKGPFEITYLPQSLGRPKADTFTYTVRTRDDAAKGAVLLSEFCENHKIDKKLSQNCGLCFEEVTAGMMSHCPDNQKKIYKVETKAFYEEGHIEISFYNNLPEFNTDEAMALYHSDNPEEGMGLRIVAAMAEKIDYNFAIGTNTLKIKL